jgi:hypothetical protein
MSYRKKKRKADPEKAAKSKERRAALMQISKMIKDNDLLGYGSVNECLIEEFYKKDGHEEFHLFWGWKEKGFKVKKGSEGFPVWSAKDKRVDVVHKKEPAEPGADPEEEKMKYWPMAYLFSNLQVEPMNDEEKARYEARKKKRNETTTNEASVSAAV